MSDSETVTGTAPREGEEQPVPWFYRIEPSDDPWRDWFAMLDFPHHGPLDVELERDVEALCRAADRRRMGDRSDDQSSQYRRWSVRSPA
jgi:hypothetical protein